MTVQAQAHDLATSPGLHARTLNQPDPGVARAQHTRTRYELDPTTGHRRPL